jgi:predicted P-loop ATPase
MTTNEMTEKQDEQLPKSVVDYLDSLVWDATPRLDRWLIDCAGATDGRRFWPVNVRSFDLPRLDKIRDQLWVEASVIEAAGKSIDLAPAA